MNECSRKTALGFLMLHFVHNKMSQLTDHYLLTILPQEVINIDNYVIWIFLSVCLDFDTVITDTMDQHIGYILSHETKGFLQDMG